MTRGEMRRVVAELEETEAMRDERALNACGITLRSAPGGPIIHLMRSGTPRYRQGGRTVVDARIMKDAARDFGMSLYSKLSLFLDLVHAAQRNPALDEHLRKDCGASYIESIIANTLSHDDQDKTSLHELQFAYGSIHSLASELPTAQRRFRVVRDLVEGAYPELQYKYSCRNIGP